MNNGTTFQGNGEVAYIPVVVNGKQSRQTNGDNFRAMTDEELAEVLINLPNHLGCNDPNDGCMMDFSENELCSKCVLEWLRQECE